MQGVDAFPHFRRCIFSLCRLTVRPSSLWVSKSIGLPQRYRIRALSRRGADVRTPILEVGSLRLDPATHEVQRNGHRIALTKTEFAFLGLLIRRPGQVMTREVILDSVWGFDKAIESNTIDAFVRLLRNKIDVDGEPRLIHTVRGIGYVLREEPE